MYYILSDLSCCVRYRRLGAQAPLVSLFLSLLLAHERIANKSLASRYEGDVQATLSAQDSADAARHVVQEDWIVAGVTYPTIDQSTAELTASIRHGRECLAVVRENDRKKARKGEVPDGAPPTVERHRQGSAFLVERRYK